MIEAVEKYKNKGGRLMYLGGNGFYWRISYDNKSTDIIECRKSEGGIRTFETKPGESYTSTTGEYSGLWRRNGIPPNKLTGIGMVSQGFDVSSPYYRTNASYNEKVKFIFNGVKEKIIGNFGLSGGGASGLEIDSVNKDLGSPDNILILASSKKHTDVYMMTPEDMLDPAPGMGGTEAEIIKSDMVFFKTLNNGAVFSVGSIAWAGSMAWNNYKNNVSKITKNVLDGFLKKTKFK
jgi:N,N-dimethylformamidase|tara:strand:- start:50 stop:754 length:705 start_codon:yes stop_codon:yes gene_type:complete